MRPSPEPARLRLLGPSGLRLSDGREARGILAQPKRLAFLAYLAVEPGLQRKDHLLALFWPEQGGTNARGAMRQTMYFLRQALEADDLFETRGADEVGIAPGRLWCDAAALADAWRQGRWQEVADLYRGALLEGFHVSNVEQGFDRWLDEQRGRIRERAFGAVRALAEEAERDHRIADAVGWAREALSFDLADEVAFRELMSLLDRCGDRAGALDAYARFSERIREVYEVEPSAETRELAEAVRTRSEPVLEIRENEPSAVRGSGRRSPPRPLTRLVGRRREIEKGAGFLESGSTRLLTLTGAGGIGKTRLALEIAERLSARYADGVCYVPLAGVEDPERVAPALGEALGLDSIRGGPSPVVVREHLGDRRVLLLLDGFDRVREWGGELVDLLRSAPGVDALVTSRAPLAVSAEQNLPVPVLSLPDPDRRFPFDSEAMALFGERARGVDPEFRVTEENVDAVMEICLRLDGLPLAIELAAARIAHLPPEAMARKLDQRLSLLTRGALDLPERQRTLEATIRWSADLLDEEERALFRGLSVFAGSFGLEAVEAVWNDLEPLPIGVADGLATLVDLSLVQRLDPADGEARYAMLETIREFAARELEEGAEDPRWRAALTRHYVRWATEGRRHICTEGEEAWLRRLDRELDSLRGVLRWAREEEPVQAARLVGSLWWHWYERGLGREESEAMESALESKEVLAPEVRAQVLTGAAALAAQRFEMERSNRLFEECLELCAAVGDEAGMARTHHNLGVNYRTAGDLERARGSFLRALELCEKAGRPQGAANARLGLANVARLQGDREGARAEIRECLLEARRSGNELREALALKDLGTLHVEAGEPEEALPLLESALRSYEALGRKPEAAFVRVHLGDALLALGDPERAREAYARALATHRETGYVPGTLGVLVAFAEMTLARGEPDRAVELLAGASGAIEAAEVHDPVLLPRLERVVERAREALDPDGFERRWSAGATLALDQLVALAADLVPTLELRQQAR